ncbi:MAG: hypothetical protein GX365_04155, partial [Clostridiales bacterium]|nr:hypothetical protein [Clostridiales bacterium]
MNEHNENNLDVNQTQIASGIDVVKKKKPVAIFALGGGLLLVIAAIISYLFIPSLKNTVNMMVMK